MTTRESTRRSLPWTLVFFANLVAPAFFGSIVVTADGRLGVLTAVAGYWVLGLLAVRHDYLGRVVLKGGTAVGLSQLCPVLQIVAGCFALRVWGDIAGWKPGQMVWNRPLSWLDGFALTGLTGGALLAMALAAGAAGQAVAGCFRRPATGGQTRGLLAA